MAACTREALPWWSGGEEFALQCRDAGSILGLGAKIPHETAKPTHHDERSCVPPLTPNAAYKLISFLKNAQ